MRFALFVCMLVILAQVVASYVGWVDVGAAF